MRMISIVHRRESLSRGLPYCLKLLSALRARGFPRTPARLRVISNFGDCDCGAGKNSHARAKFQGEAKRGKRRKFSSKFRVCACEFRPLHQSESPNLETPRSLRTLEHARTLVSYAPINSKLQHPPHGHTPGIWLCIVPGEGGIWTLPWKGGEFELDLSLVLT